MVSKKAPAKRHLIADKKKSMSFEEHVRHELKSHGVSMQKVHLTQVLRGIHKKSHGLPMRNKNRHAA